MDNIVYTVQEYPKVQYRAGIPKVQYSVYSAGIWKIKTFFTITHWQHCQIALPMSGPHSATKNLNVYTFNDIILNIMNISLPEKLHRNIFHNHQESV